VPKGKTGHKTAPTKEKTVLVAVLKNLRDRRILTEEKWYRIPCAFLPKHPFSYIAFYQPATFGKNGKQIEYFAPVIGRETVRRIDLLPEEQNHPRANELYVKFSVGELQKLQKPVRNIVPRRISFGFTSLVALTSARDILQLYHIAPTEQIIEKRLSDRGLKTIAQFPISVLKKRFRIDLAILCNRGNIAIECDNYKAHSSKIQIYKDRIKDKTLQKLGWRVFRLNEKEILEKLDRSVTRIEKLTQSLGGTC
jgi:very-short-patch-repair endonuclease